VQDMTSDVNKDQGAGRVTMAFFGAIAGVSLWYLFDVLPDQIENERIIMGLAALAGAFFSATMAAAGPLSISRALIVGLACSVVPALLLCWASLRFESIEDFLTTGHPPLAYTVLITIPVPFLIAALGPAKNWRSYPELFSQSWNIVVRYAAAWLFVGVFWAVVFLSNALFEIIGLSIIEDLLDIDPVPFALTGAVLGLALAVVNELSDYVSPYLVLQLLRLLLPVVLLVVVVFIIGVPFRGLSGLFGGLSAASILMTMAIAAVTLVSTAVDQVDDDAVSTRYMRVFTQILGVILPILAGLSAYAVWARVNQHGWSPNRLAAATVAGFVLAYALTYALAVVRRRNWMGTIRSINIVLALVLIGVSAIWLSPIVNPQSISANNQVARYLNGKTEPGDLDLWSIGREWGLSGQMALDEIEAAIPANAEIIARNLENLARSDSEYEYEQLLKSSDPDQFKNLLALLPVRPLGATFPESVLEEISNTQQWVQACERKTPAGNPACIAVVAEFLPDIPGDEVLLGVNFYGGWTEVQVWSQPNPGEWKGHGNQVSLTGSNLTAEGLDKLFDGEYTIGTKAMTVISIGETSLLTLP